MAAIEFSAPDIETAISHGLQQLNLLRAEVKIEVLEEGSRGVLGIGAKPARVRLTPFEEIEAEAAAKAAKAAAQVVAQTSPAPIRVTQPSVEAHAETSEADLDDADATDEHDSSGEGDAAPKIEGEDLAFSIVRGMLDRMGLTQANVGGHSVVPADSDDEPSIWIDIAVDEDDENVFLGYQNEGLIAFQTVVQTMWSHQTKSSLRVNVDVNGHRARRQQQLVNMARRMAERVLENGKPIMLEPMPASERRIVHMTLRQIDGVETESSGEGSSRKVQIKPKR